MEVAALGRGLHEMSQQWDEQSLDGGGVFGSNDVLTTPGCTTLAVTTA
jgi:hypothetical protein